MTFGAQILFFIEIRIQNNFINLTIRILEKINGVWWFISIEIIVLGKQNLQYILFQPESGMNRMNRRKVKGYENKKSVHFWTLFWAGDEIQTRDP